MSLTTRPSAALLTALVGIVLSLTAITAPALASGDWSFTPSLPAPQSSAQGALLTDGTVLLAGGYGGGGANPAPARFDVGTKRWSSAAQLLQQRSLGALVALQDGRALLTAGYSWPEGYQSSTVLYDPATDSWTPTGALHEARANASAVQLDDGRVLLVGGSNAGADGNGQVLSSAELYDPRTGTWSETAPMANDRNNSPSLVKLRDGRVLVVGGTSYTDYLAAAEVFDPATETWSSAGRLHLGRYGGMATMLRDGRVIYAGGFGWDGTGGVRPSKSADIYDPATNTWATAADMASPRYEGGSALLEDGRVMVLQGYADAANTSTEIYDPATDTWSIGPSLNRSRMRDTIVDLGDGRILAAGGDTNGYPFYTDASELFGPVALPPSAPTAVRAEASGRDAVVSWGAPSSDGGNPVVSYRITASPGEHVEYADPSADSRTITGLDPGTTYTFTVAAASSAGWSDESAPSSGLTIVAPPSPPRAVTAAAGDSEAAISWLAPSSDGGSPLDRYVVRGANGAALAVVPATTTRTTVTGLPNDQAATFTVQAINQAGWDARSAESNTVTPRSGLSRPVTAVGTFEYGGTVTTDPGSGPTSTLPVTSTVAVPWGSPGTVAISQATSDAGAPSGSGYEFVGQQLDIHVTRPDGSRLETSVNNPLRLTFDVDPSLIPAADGMAAIAFYRDGALVPDCVGGALDPAMSDPVCILARTPPDGSRLYGTITILSTHASRWNLAQKRWPFRGFAAPIRMTALNQVNAGSAIPVKFGLDGYRSESPLDGPPLVRTIACAGKAVPGAPEPAAAAGKTALTYAKGADQYEYVWKTDAGWSGCKQLIVRLKDGSSHRADFSFKK